MSFSLEAAFLLRLIHGVATISGAIRTRAARGKYGCRNGQQC